MNERTNLLGFHHIHLQAFKDTNINDHLFHQFHQYLRSELEIWAPPGSRLMHTLKGAMKLDGIDWPSLRKALDSEARGHLRRVDIKNRKWPYFLEWLRKFTNGVGDRPLELLVCNFFSSDNLGYDYPS